MRRRGASRQPAVATSPRSALSITATRPPRPDALSSRFGTPSTHHTGRSAAARAATPVLLPFRTLEACARRLPCITRAPFASCMAATFVLCTVRVDSSPTPSSNPEISPRPKGDDHPGLHRDPFPFSKGIPSRFEREVGIPFWVGREGVAEMRPIPSDQSGARSGVQPHPPWNRGEVLPLPPPPRGCPDRLGFEPGA